MPKPSLLITGATGLVGSRFVELYGEKYTINNIDLVTGVDITSLPSVESFVATHPAASLIHLAAFTNTAEANNQQGDKNGLCYKVNVLGTKNIVSACRKYNIHLIHISTDFVFDGTKKTPYTEEDLCHPLDWYGMTKLLAEKEVESSGVSYTILRISYPYRAKFAAKPDLVEKIKQGLIQGDLPPQFSDTLITPTFIDDIAKGFDYAATHHPLGIYHLVGSSSHSPYELACMVAEHYGFSKTRVPKGSLTAYQKQNSRPFARYVQLSNQKLIKDFGFRPLSFAEGLSKIKNQPTA